MSGGELVPSEPPKTLTLALTPRQIGLALSLLEEIGDRELANVERHNICAAASISERQLRQIQEHQAALRWTLDGDQRELARARLEAGALQLAETVVNTEKADVALKTLGKLDVVRDDKDGGGSGTAVQVNIGFLSAPE